MLTLERDDSALLPGMFRLAVTAPDEQQPTIQAVDGSFALIGRAEGCTCRFDHPSVGRRHAYLQAIYGRIYCIDLGSASGTLWGDTPRSGGWLDPDDLIRIGPYQVRLVDAMGLGAGAEALPADFNPLDRYNGDAGPLPEISLHVRGAGRRAHYTVSRPITLVGTSAACKLRLGDSSVSSIHCSLLWLPDGLWVVDLAGKGGTSLQGKNVRCAKLAEGDKLRVGKFMLRVHYPGEPEAHRRHAKSGVEPLRLPTAGTDPEIPTARLEAERASMAADRADLELKREGIELQRQANEERQQLLEGREMKLSEAQMRLAAEWDRLHADRSGMAAVDADLARRQEDLVGEVRKQLELAESLERQRKEMSVRAAELAETRKNLKVEWKKLEAARAKVTEVKQRLAAERAELSALKEELQRRKFDLVTSEDTPPEELDIVSPAPQSPTTHEFDVLESTRHNKVFSTERNGDTLVVIPLGDASEFHYGDVHTESNKVRRLLEGGAFKNLIVDLGSAPVFSAVTINVVVALSRIASNRGGRAVLCTASEKTRGVLQTMKLLELWPLFTNRDEAIRALANSSDA